MPVLRLLATLLLGLLVLTSEAAGGEPKVVVTIDRNGDAFIIDAAFEVEVPPATAWGVLTDFDNMSSILTNLKSSRITSREGNTWMVKQAGAAKFGLFSFSFWSEREVRVEPMQRIMVKGLAGSVKRMSSETRMEARGPGVQIRYKERVENIARTPAGFFVRTSKGELRAQHVLLAIGRRVTPRKLGVEGEGLPKVVYRLIDAEQYRGKRVLVVGGGDNAL